MTDFLLNPWAIAGAFTGVAGLAVAAWFFAPALISFFASTSIGRRIAAIGAVIFSVWLIAVKIFSAGRAKEREVLKQNSERKENERRALDETLNKLPDDKLRSRSDRWVR